MRHPKVRLYLWFTLFALFSSQSQSLPSDRKQIIQVFADSANLSQKERRGIYIGHVQFIQGTTHIQADRAMTKITKENQLSLAIAHGSKSEQAHYWSETDPKKPPLHAYADSLRYYPKRHLIELKGHARVEQGKNSFSAAKISYDTLSEHVLSESAGRLRTSIVIHPEKKPA